MRAGSFDRRITIQRKAVTLSDSGDGVETLTNLVVRRPASMWPLNGDERFASPQEVASEQVEFRVRHSSILADLTPLDRVIYPALTTAQAADSGYVIPTRSIYDVLVASEIGRREGIKIITQRRADVTT